MSTFSFGEYIDGKDFKVLDERIVRASSGIMFITGAIAAINGFLLQRFEVIPYFTGFLALNFGIGIFINPKFMPTTLLAMLFVRKQSPLPIGAVQKRFAWSLGFTLTFIIFGLSLLTLRDASYFEPVCILCIVCLVLLYLETAFAICIGCKIYHLCVKTGLIPKPKQKPNCMGDVCET